MLTQIRNIAFLLSLPLWLSVALSSKAMAVQTTELYRVDALVSSQQVQERNDAVQASLANIVVRISGRRDSVNHPVITQALKRANDYVSSFSYGKTDSIIQREGNDVVATELRLQFSPKAVDTLLRRAELPLWPANRHTVLLWLVQDDRSAGRLYQNDNALLEVLNATAKRRGLPLQHPLLDLEDQMLVSVNELWDMNEVQVQSASERYGADIIVVGRYSEIVRGGESQWFANWHILRRDGDTLLETQAETAEQALLEGIELVADDLASRFAIIVGDSRDGAITLQLAGVDSFKDYAQAIDYLEGLAMIVSAEPVVVADNKMALSLTTEGDVSLLTGALFDGGKLLIDDSFNSASNNRYAPLGSVDNPMRYFWLERPTDLNAMDAISSGAAEFQQGAENVIDGENTESLIPAND